MYMYVYTLGVSDNKKKEGYAYPSLDCPWALATNLAKIGQRRCVCVCAAGSDDGLLE
jgi:hypothetical protein